MSIELFLVVSVLTACTAAAQPEASVFAAPPTVLCASEGRLPDPTDCSFYLDCTGNTTSGFTYTITPCASGSYYNACSEDCSRTTRPDNCSVSCTPEDIGEVTVSDDNAGVYSFCYTNDTATYITVGECPNGTSFDPASGCGGVATNCSPGGPTTGNCNGSYYYGDLNNCSLYYYCSGPNEQPYPMGCPGNEYYISYNHSCVGFTCSSQGFVADPANCTKYYFCDSNNNSVSFECPSGSYYDSSLAGCRLGNCSNTCPGAGNNTDTGGANFTCSSAGFFADPYNCSWYYFCDSNLNPSRIECPRGSYFDPSLAGCVIGQCPRRRRFTTDSHHAVGQLHPHISMLDSYVFGMPKTSQRQLRKLSYLDIF